MNEMIFSSTRKNVEVKENKPKKNVGCFISVESPVQKINRF